MATLALAAATLGRAQVLTESFTGAAGTTPAGWVFAGTGYTPNLTGPADGGGWLRLTSNGGNQATSAYYDTAFSASGATVYASFEYATWGGNGADGITFFLFDGSSTFSVGADGGSMGYAQKTGVDGLAGGYIGVAIDEFGNFSNATEGRVGGVGFTPDSISVRGSEASSYAYLGGSSTLATSIDTPGVGTRPVVFNQVQILLNATNQLTVTLQQGGTSPQTVLQMDLSAYTRPETLKLGFTSGTGGQNNYHDVRNIAATTVAASLWSNANGNSQWGSNTNWNPTVVPTAGEDILFDNTYVSTNQTIDTQTDRTVRSITFDAPIDYTINNNTITFDNQGVAGFSGVAATQTHGTGAHTINSNLALQNDIYVRNSTAGSLTINGGVATNGHALTFDGTGVSTAENGAISGTGSVIKNDSGTVTLAGANSYSGGTAVNYGTLNANASTALGSGAVVLNGGTLGSTNGSTIANNVTITSDVGVNGIGLSGTVTNSGGDHTVALNGSTISGALKLSEGNTGRTVTTAVTTNSIISGVISNGGTGAGSLTKEGAGTLTLSGVNTYTGLTTINDGTVQLGASNLLADTSSLSIGSSGALNLNGFSEKVGALTAADGATLDFGTAGTANTFIFGSYAPPSSGVFVVNNWESGTDRLASSVSGGTVSSIYISGYGVAQKSGTSTNFGTIDGSAFGTGYLLTPAAQTVREWDGSSSSSWLTSNNWTSPNVPNGTTEFALFDNLGLGRTTVNLNNGNGGTTTIGGLTFGENATSSYTLQSSGTGTQTLQLQSAVPYIQQKSDVTQTIALEGLRLAGNTVADVTGAGDLVISTAISETGTRALIRDGTGAGKLILSGNNTFSGGLYVNSGIVQAQNAGALGTGTAVIADGATLEFSNSGSINEAIQVTGSGVAGAGAVHNVAGSNTLSGTITELGATRIAADAGTTLSLTGNLTGTDTATTFAGPGNISVSRITTGAGTVAIESGAVTYTGGNANTNTGLTTLSGGTLTLDKTAGVNGIGTGGLVANTGTTVSLVTSNQIADAASVTLNGTATLDLANNSEKIAQLNSTSTTSTVALGTGNITIGAASVVNSSYAGQITGGATSTLNVDGFGTVYLSGNNTGFSGTTNVTAGSLNITGYNEVLGSGAINVASGGNLQVQGGLDIDNTVTLSGTGVSNNGALQNFGGSNTISGSVTLNSDSRINASSGSLDVTGNVTGSNTNLSLGGTANVLISGNIVTGTGTIDKDGTGTVTLSGNNTFAGATTVSAGTLIARSDNALGSVAAGTSVADGATLRIENNVNIANEALTVTGAGRLLNASGTNTFGGVVSGTGNVVVSAGQLTLSNTNTYTGDTAVNGGTLLITSDDALGAGGTTTVASGATLALQNNIYVDTETNIALAGTGDGGVGALRNVSGNNTVHTGISLTADSTVTSSAGTLYLGDSTLTAGTKSVSLGANTLTLNTAGGDIQLRSSLTGTGGLIKDGSGTLVMRSGNNTNTGDTLIKDGALVIDTYNNANSGINGTLTIGDGVGAAQSAVYKQGQVESGVPGGLANELIKNTSNVVVNSDGYWNLQGYKETINNLTLDGGMINAQNSIGAGDRLDVIGDITSTNASQTATIDGRIGMNNDTAKSINVSAGTLDINAVLSNGGFVKTGAGTLELSGGNSFTGTAQINQGVVLVNNSLGLGAAGGSTIVASGAQLQLSDVNIATEPLTINGSGISGDGALRSNAGTTNTWGGTITMGSNAEIETATGSTLTVNGSISGSGTVLTVDSIGDTVFNGSSSSGTLTKTGGGTLTLNNATSFGTANINYGTATLGADNILLDSMDINLGAAGTLNIGNHTDTFDDLAGSGTLQIGSSGSLTIDNLGNGGAFTGTLDVDGVFTLNGGIIGGGTGAGSTGTMVLTAGSTLQIAASYDFGGTLELNAGTTLMLAGAGTTFNLDTLHITGNTVIDFSGVDATTFNIGSLVIDPGVTVSAIGWNSFYDLWTATTFSGATLDNRNGTTAQITFNGFTPSDTTWLTYDYGAHEITVPEPATYGAVLMGLGLVGFGLRRRGRPSHRGIAA